MKDRYSYIAIFSYDSDGISISFPDLPGCLPCADKDNSEQAIHNAREAMGLHLYGMEQDGDDIPTPSPVNKINLDDNEVPILIDVYMPPIRDKVKNHFVKKTLSIPAWINDKALDMGINFSQVLQEALLNKIKK